MYLCPVPCDMRRSFHGLSMMAEHLIGCNPFSGHLRVFCNRRNDRVKILYGDRDGWAIWYKRLEAGTFQFPFAETGRKEVAAWELALRLQGIDLSRGPRRKRYSLPAGMHKEEGEEAGRETQACGRALYCFVGTCILFLTNADSHDIAIGMRSGAQIQRRIAQLRRQLLALGPLHPGSLRPQYNVCGTPGCRCKDPKHPEKHGPYYQLSFPGRGKSSTRFLRPQQLGPMRQKVANYKRLRALVNDWVELEMAREGAEGEKQKQAGGH